ncbi:hypothetical protein ABFA25_03480 [Mycobacterium lepromatosis]|nr:hypothetical protein [Mycobacterium lepromatosis]
MSCLRYWSIDKEPNRLQGLVDATEGHHGGDDPLRGTQRHVRARSAHPIC